MISTTTAIGFGAIMAGIIAGWNQVKSYLLQVYGLFMHRASMDWSTSRNLRLYLHKNALWQASSKKFFWVRTKTIKNEITPLLALYKEHSSDSKIFLVTGGFIIISSSNGGIDTLTCPRTVNIDKLLSKAIAAANDVYRSCGDTTYYTVHKTGSRFYNRQEIRKSYETERPAVSPGNSNQPTDEESSWLVNYKHEDIGCAIIPFLDNLYLTPVMQSAVDDAERWFKSRLWYEKHNVRWKRGWLLYGKPGCGKTRFVEAVAQKLKLPVLVFDLASMTNEDFRREVDCLNSPRILLFEDFDTVFEGRTNVTSTDMSPGLTFDCFLNGIDGINTHPGVFTVITTNRVECLDSAIAGVVDGDGGTTRPGRVDRIFELSCLPYEGLVWMANKILGDFPKEKWEDLLLMQNQTGAQFQEKCCRRAMDLYWENKQ